MSNRKRKKIDILAYPVYPQHLRQNPPFGGLRLNWRGTITPQVSSFLASYDLSGKRVIPFITHGGGGVQNTVRDLTVQCSGCKIEPNAWTSYGQDMSKLDEWLKALKL